jgi:hypothetical protein
MYDGGKVNSFVGRSDSLSTMLRGQEVGTWNYNTLGTGSGNAAAHEFAHLLGGVNDKPGAVLSDTQPELEPARATVSDFRWGIQEAAQAVNSTLHPGFSEDRRHQASQTLSRWEFHFSAGGSRCAWQRDSAFSLCFFLERK